ncbi:hypothetical protein [Labilithrix luteola]|uniref:hypothetical protein n=1 Tax=Labilithrix luteola TaxID=1391654 RepID=UPI00196A0EF9|nr:hypothetical protein [Labilithrix luteola]
MTEREMHCRVCGLEQSDPPWGDGGNCASFDICDCCGTEFGYEDCSPEAATCVRSAWLAKGAPWFRPRSRPADWDVNAQLRNVPQGYE